MSVAVKICGVTRADDLESAIENGAAFIGFNFYPPSPRCLSMEAWKGLAGKTRGRVPAVAVTVDPDDRLIDEILEAGPLDYIQLHGSETPERAQELRARTGVRIIKAIAVSNDGDVARHDAYMSSADMILFDAKAPKTPGAIPGGNGLSFDWRLLAGQRIALPWLLAGGIDADNVEAAVKLTGASIVDASSRIESAP
ncbi:MAG: phosphoribosylanthranilate isomerase, partial [Geminicoccaceae bacterium]